MTGKHGKGVIPIADEPLGPPSVYDAHRLFIYVRDTAQPDIAQDKAIDALEKAGQPVVRIGVTSKKNLGQEFFRLEMATAVAGAIISINPFDQPDVEAAKVAARELTDAYEKSGTLAADKPVFKQNGIALYTDERNAQALRQAGANSTLESWLARAIRPPARRRLFCCVWPISNAATPTCARCKSCARRFATASGSPPACNSVRAICTRPARPTRAGRIPACSCKSPPTQPRT